MLSRIWRIFARNRIYEDTALNFIKAFPHAYIVREKRIDALYNNLRKVDARHDYYYKRLARQLKDTAMDSFPGVDKDHADVKTYQIWLAYCKKTIDW